MNICVAGWYFRETFLRRLMTYASGGRDVRVIKHREANPDRLSSWWLPSDSQPNRGLEFGCYQFYLESRWDGESDVLFIHDDSDVDQDALHQISRLRESGFDQIYLFNNEYEEFVNAGRHGRAMWCRGAWLAKFRESGGFPVDWSNLGDTEGPELNNGIRDFQKKLAEFWPETTGFAAIVPGLHLGRRGWMSDQVYVYKRTASGLMTPPEECFVSQNG